MFEALLSGLVVGTVAGLAMLPVIVLVSKVFEAMAAGDDDEE
jgi:hypothetical protein